MVHGQPDFGMYAPKTKIYGQADVGELAARLGSICTYDRRGDVVWLDDFESSETKWYAEDSGAGEVAGQSSERARSGSYSYRMDLGAAIDRWASIRRYFAPLNPAKIGVEISWSQYLLIENNRFEMWLIHYNGTRRYDFRVALDTSGIAWPILKYWDSTPDWHVIETVNANIAEELFLNMKLVINSDTHKYERILLGAKEYDASAFSVSDGPSGTGEQFLVLLKYSSLTAGAVNRAYIDDFIITQNEP